MAFTIPPSTGVPMCRSTWLESEFSKHWGERHIGVMCSWSWTTSQRESISGWQGRTMWFEYMHSGYTSRWMFPGREGR